MVKHTQAIRRSVFDHFVGLAFKWFNKPTRIKKNMTKVRKNLDFFFF